MYLSLSKDFTHNYTPPAPDPIVLPVGYMDQPTGLLHIYLWRYYVAGREGGYPDNLFGRLSG